MDGMKPQSTHVLVGSIAAGLLIGVLAFTFSGDGENAQTETDVRLRTLAAGAFGGFESRTNYLIRSEEELQEVWLEVFGTEGDVPPLPTVNFEEEYVLAVFQGEKPTTGYSIHIESIKDSTTSRTVTIALEEPTEDCITAGAISTPFFIAAYPKSELPIDRVEEVRKTCAHAY